MDRLSVGVDLGQASDPTAIAIADGSDFRHLERVPLGTPYPQVCERIGSICGALPGARLVVDGTGGGRAVVDSLEAAGLSPIVVTITSGKKERREGSRIWIPKALLLRPLIAGLEDGSIRIAATLTLAGALMKELRAFQVVRGERGHLAFNGKGEHDDLVIAAALAVRPV